MHDCSIVARGYRADFHFDFSPSGRGIDLEVCVSIINSPQPFATSTTACILLDDVVHLACYVEDHMARLASDPDAESITWVPLELNFQMQALSGEVRAADDGEFTLIVMANLFDPGSEQGSVYAGCKGVVEVAAARIFASRLREIAAWFSSAGAR